MLIFLATLLTTVYSPWGAWWWGQYHGGDRVGWTLPMIVVAIVVVVGMVTFIPLALPAFVVTSKLMFGTIVTLVRTGLEAVKLVIGPLLSALGVVL